MFNGQLYVFSLSILELLYLFSRYQGFVSVRSLNDAQRTFRWVEIAPMMAFIGHEYFKWKINALSGSVCRTAGYPKFFTDLYTLNAGDADWQKNDSFYHRSEREQFFLHSSAWKANNSWARQAFIKVFC